VSLQPFRIHVTDEKLASIRASVQRYPWQTLPDAGGWSCGTSVEFVRGLAEYWLERYDWRAQEARLNALPQFQTRIDGVDLHFYHIRGTRQRDPDSSCQPLLLIHGWPGSVFEFLHLVAPLTDPVRFGGVSTDAFDVVIPALPGFGFSGRPAQPIGPRAIAALYDRLMTEILGYESYLTQGGDWGAFVSTWLGLDFPRSCAGLHLNMIVTPPGSTDELSEAELKWLIRSRATQLQEGGYGRVQSTRPQSLAFAMHDSPVGIAAWIIEKFAAWSDLPRAADGSPDLLARYSYDDLLTNIMFYVATDAFASSTWIYRGLAQEVDTFFANRRRCDTPTAIAAFPDPVFSPQPRSLAERNYRILRWTDMPRGGHFAALEEPQLLLEDIKAFRRMLREDSRGASAASGSGRRS
jgi:pimeloyl-ACP methyl ester carboxylesterase